MNTSQQRPSLWDPRVWPSAYRQAIILFIGGISILFIGMQVIQQMEEARYSGRQEGTEAIVEVGLSTIGYFHGLELSGELTTEEAQAQAREAVGALRYGADDYYWIHNEDLVMEMHPFKPELDGTDISQIADPNGVFLFQEMNDVVAADGGGLVDYMWPKPGFDDPQPKTSFVAGFEPWGWIIGSGVYIDDIEADLAVDRGVLLFGGAVQALVVAAAIGVVAALYRRLRQFTTVADRVAEGDLDIEPLEVRELGTVGRLADSFNAMIATLQEVGAQANRIADNDISSSHRVPGELGRAFDSMVDSVGETVRRLSTSSAALSDAANNLIDVATRVGKNAEVTANEASTSSSAGDEVSASVASVAAAVEEMNLSIRDVARNATDAANAAAEAVEIADESSSTISKLSESSEEIGNVIQVIRSIAEQTNLLALNATIEAARAGEAGRGFAVVANEVKGLADQTAKATEDIVERIEAIQADTASAIEANARIGGSIEKISSISTAIASAVDQQSSTTSEIGRSVEETAAGSQSIASSISGVASAAAETTRSLQETRTATDSIQEIAHELDELASSFH